MNVNKEFVKSFYKALNYIIKFWAIFIIYINLPSLLKITNGIYLSVFHPELFRWGEIINFGLGDYSDNIIFLLFVVFVIIGWVLVLLIIRTLLYRPQNVYSETSPTPKDDLFYWKILPIATLEVYGYVLIGSLISKLLNGSYLPIEFEFFHLVLIYIIFRKTRKNYLNFSN